MGARRARRRSVVVAAILTTLILLGYGGYTLFQRSFGSTESSAPAGDGFAASVERATGFAQYAIGAGLDVHLTGDLEPFRDGVNRLIDNVRAEQAHLEALTGSTTGPRAETLRSAIAVMVRLESAMGQWRDTIVQMRFGSVDASQRALEQSIAEMNQSLQTWNAQSP